MTGTWIEVFKAGRQTDSSGNTREWTEQDLDDIVTRYNGQTDHEAPIVVGHPEHNSPAFGWVEALKRDGKLLFGKFRDVMPEFADLVKAGTYKKRSISLYPDLTLRHIGFLGGMPPAVKGLANVFKEGQEAITYEFSDWRMTTLGRVIMRMRDYLVEKEGTDKADGIISSWDVQDLLTPPPEPDQLPITSYHEEEGMKPEEVQKIVNDAIGAAALQFGEQLKTVGDTIKEFKTQLESVSRDLAKGSEAALQREFNEFLQTEAMQKRIPQSQRAATVAHLMSLVAAPAVEFGEGDQKKAVTAVDDYKARLQALPEVVQFGEHATRDKVGDTRVNGMSAELLSQKAVEFQDAEARAGRTISMTQAVNHIKAGGTA